MHDAVPDCDRVQPMLATQPIGDCCKSRVDIGYLIGSVIAINQVRSIGRGGAQTRLGADTAHLPSQTARQAIVGLNSKNLELDA